MALESPHLQLKCKEPGSQLQSYGASLGAGGECWPLWTQMWGLFPLWGVGWGALCD